MINYNLDIKRSASTVLCIVLLKEIIDYYSERDSDMTMTMTMTMK